jgi:hypothetical protein
VSSAPRAELLNKGASENYYYYDVVVDGEVIVRDAWEPCFEACRVLHGRGVIGAVMFLDHKTLKPRLYHQEY